MGDRGSSLLLCHISHAWVFLINYRHNCESFSQKILKKKMIQQYIRRFSSSSSLSLYVNPPYSTILFSFRLPSSSLSAWIGCSTHLIPVSSHHRVPRGTRGLRCSLGYGFCLIQCICQECVKRKR